MGLFGEGIKDLAMPLDCGISLDCGIDLIHGGALE